MLLQTEGCMPKMSEMEPLQGERILQTAATAVTAAMHSHPEGCTHPPLPVPPFLLAQNLSSKWIVPPDNMWPNFNDDCSRHW